MHWLYFSFVSGKILETLSPRHLPSPHHHLNPLSLTVRPPPSPPSQPPTPPRTPLSPPHHKSGNSPLSSHHQQQTPQPSQQSQPSSVYETLRNKMADSMAKLAGLQSNSIMGNPRVSHILKQFWTLFNYWLSLTIAAVIKPNMYINKIKSI